MFFPYEKLPNSTNQTIAIDVREILFMAERFEITLLIFSPNPSFSTEKSNSVSAYKLISKFWERGEWKISREV